MTIEERILEALDEHEGTESFNLPLHPKQSRPALQRLKRKGLAEATQCPDGAWVWFRLHPTTDS
jgi:hypothetical protein